MFVLADIDVASVDRFLEGNLLQL